VTVEVRGETIRQRLASGYADVQASNLAEAIALCERAKADNRAVGIVLRGNMAEVCEEALEKRWAPDIVTEMCPCPRPFCAHPRRPGHRLVRKTAPRGPKPSPEPCARHHEDHGAGDECVCGRRLHRL